MDINSAGPVSHLIIDQNKQVDIYKTSGNIQLAGLSFNDTNGAKAILDNGQNFHTMEQSDNVPSHISRGINALV